MSRVLRIWTHRNVAVFLTGVYLAGACLMGGCVAPAGGRTSSGQTQTDRLRNHYADLAGGRFAVIADFEEASHIELFRAVGGETGDVSVVSNAGIEQTGGTCLRVRFRSSDSLLVADNENAVSWLLKRDWRSYDLLLMNVFCPVQGMNMDLAITSGEGENVGEAHSLVPLQSGWNLLRLDLDEASDFIALDDVRRLTWSIPGLADPVDLKIDDIVLAENRSAVFGQADAAPGSLYVYRQGRRLHVGAAGRFEIGFAGGQIVRWYALDRDPLRRNDLVGAGNALGPTPVVLPDDDPDVTTKQAKWPAGFASLGKLVGARQRVVEANTVRAIVECTWTFRQDAVQVDDDLPEQKWRYVIYASGQIYVTVEATVRSDGFAPAHVGLMVNRALTDGMVFDTHEPGRLREHPDLQHVSYLFSSLDSKEAGLLFVLHDSRQAPRMRVLRMSDEGRVSMLASGGHLDGPIAHWSCAMRVWRTAAERKAGPATDAASYIATPAIEFLVGDFDRDSPGDAGSDGFDEQSGTYMLSPDGNRVQLELDGRETPCVRPAFCVRGVGDREAWVYVDYAIHHPVARNDAGDLLFQLPMTVTDRTVIEVYLRRQQTDR